MEINQSKFLYQAHRLVDYGELEVWGKPLIPTMSGQVVVALLNRKQEEQPICFDLESVGIDFPKCYVIKDLWTKKTFETLSDSTLSRQVPAYGVMALKIVGESLATNIYQYENKN